jgi:hypothetical protein
VELVCILDQNFKVLGNKFIELVNVQWTHYGPEYARWEHEETMQELFGNTGIPTEDEHLQ